MAKGNKAAQVANTGAQATGPRIVLVSKAAPAAAKLRGARAAWYAHLTAQAGNTPAQFAVAALANPPSTPTKGKLAGQCEPPAGWLGWFVRHGFAELQS
jgi:hypothetical protein